MTDQLYERIDEAVCMAADAFEQIETIKEEVYEELNKAYTIPPEKEDDVWYLLSNMFEFMNVGGMVVSLPGAPTLETIIDFITEE